MESTKPKVKEYADGWITEQAGTEIPGFLKLAYIVIAGGALAYFLIYMNVDVNHSERGHLVLVMNTATDACAGLMYPIAAMIVIFGVVVVAFSFGKPHD